jgi:hypothetical protein
VLELGSEDRALKSAIQPGLKAWGIARFVLISQFLLRALDPICAAMHSDDVSLERQPTSMSDVTTKAAAATFVALPNRTFSPWSVGIAGRLAISFIAVAGLAVVANLIVEGKVSVLRMTDMPHDTVAPVTPHPAAAPVSQPALPPPPKVVFPNSDLLLLETDRLDRAVAAASANDSPDMAARYQQASNDFEHAAAEFAAAVAAAGQPAPARFLATAKSYRLSGADLVRLAASRRGAITDYRTHFEQLNTRVKQSVDHSWNIFGRVVARQSLMRLTDNLDDLRRKYSEFVSVDNVDSPAYDALGASEGTLVQTLTQDRAGFSRADGEEWYAKSPRW